MKPLASLDWLTRHRRAVLLGCALLALVLVPGLLRLDTDNSPEVFFARGSAGVERYRAFHEDFGSDLFVRLVARGEGLWTPSGVAWLARLAEQAEAVPGVESVAGPYRHHRAGWPAAEATEDEIFELRRRLQANRLDRELGLISAAGTTVTAIALLADAAPADELETLAGLRAVLAASPAGVTTELAGPPLLNHALNDSSREIERRFFPLLVLFTAGLLMLAVRDLAGLVIPLLFVGFCELLTLAPMGYAGTHLNMVLAVLPPLLFAIALATALHVLLRLRDLGEEADADVDARSLCLAAYHEKGWAVFWTGLTTLIAFASLALSPVGPVRALGLWAALALALLTLAAFTFYPVLLSLPAALGRRHRSVFELGLHRLGAHWGHWDHRHRRAVLLVAATAAIAAAAGLPRIRLESNALHYLAADHPVRAQVERLQAEGIGLTAVEVVVAPQDEDAFADAEAIARLGDLGESLAAEERVYGTVSAGAILRDAVGRTPRPTLLAPTTYRALVLAGIEADAEGRRLLASYLSADRRRARVTVFVPTVGLDEFEPLADRIRALALATFPGAGVDVTGEFPLLLAAQRHLLSTLAASLGVTLIAIFIILRTLLPGTRLALLALVPNLWPVIGVLGLMGWLRIPLDIATVMVAAVVLGLAVDDTLHTLGHFRKLAPRLGAHRAVARTLEVTAPAYVLTGVILAAGFGVCAFSDFAPIARFGALSAFAIVLAVLGDLFLLPALLSLTPRSTLERWRG